MSTFDHSPLHKVFYPCNRCHLATLLENQRVTCGNEVTRVTQHWCKGKRVLLFLRVFVSPCSPKYCMGFAKPWASRVEGAASKGRSPGLHGSEVPPSWGEGTASRPLGIIPKGLGDSFPLPPRGCFA